MSGAPRGRRGRGRASCRHYLAIQNARQAVQGHGNLFVLGAAAEPVKATAQTHGPCRVQRRAAARLHSGGCNHTVAPQGVPQLKVPPPPPTCRDQRYNIALQQGPRLGGQRNAGREGMEAKLAKLGRVTLKVRAPDGARRMVQVGEVVRRRVFLVQNTVITSAR